MGPPETAVLAMLAECSGNAQLHENGGPSRRSRLTG